MKNYGDPTEITLVTGNLGPLFNRYVDFMYHYYLLYNSNEKQNVYQTARNIANFHALAGGILTASSKNTDNFIVSQKAQYLVINDSHAAGRVRVYSVKDLAERFLRPEQDSSDAFKIEGDEVLRRPPATDIFKELNASKSHIALMLKSLPN